MPADPMSRAFLSRGVAWPTPDRSIVELKTLLVKGGSPFPGGLVYLIRQVNPLAITHRSITTVEAKIDLKQGIFSAGPTC